MNRILSTILAFCALLLAPGATAVAETANVAPNGTAYTSGTLYGAMKISQINDADRGNVAHLDTDQAAGVTFSIDLGKDYAVSDIKIYPRQDGCCPERLTKIRVSLNKDDGAGAIGAEVWGVDLFADGSNPGAKAGGVVDVPLPSATNGRWVQVKSLADPVPSYSLQMTELEVYADVPASQINRALNTAVTATGDLYAGQKLSQVTDGSRSGAVHAAAAPAAGFSYSINLGATVNFDHIVVWPRQDACCPERLSNYEVSIHKDNAGVMGDVVWKASLHTDGSNPGSDPGSKDVLTAALDATGQFKGQWIQLKSLDATPPDYALQVSEVEAFGVVEGAASLLINQQPESVAVGVGRTATFTVGVNIPGGDASKISYQWQKDGVNIEGSNTNKYTTPPLLLADDGKKFRCVISYPGVASVTSSEATVRLNLAYQAEVSSNRPLWANGGWNISMITDGDRSAAIHGDVDIATGMAYEINLGTSVKMEEIVIFPRQDGCCPERLENFKVSVHADKAGAIGDSVWSADFFTDGSNAGSGAGVKVSIKANLNPTGKFEGQWIRILSLEDPEPNYTMQMTEVEVYGSFTGGNPVLSILTNPKDYGTVPGRTAKFTVAAKVVNGDPSKITYQWQKNRVDIGGATTADYTTPPLLDADNGSKYRCVVSYAGAGSQTSTEGIASFDYNYAKGQPVTLTGTLWGPGNWDISVIVDGDRSNLVHGDTAPPAGFSYAINLGAEVEIDKIDIYPRQDGCCPERLGNVRLTVNKDNNGQIGDPVWSADLFADGTNAGSGAGLFVDVTKGADPAGSFRGNWVKILALGDPIPDYYLQIAEFEVYGHEVPGSAPVKLSVSRTATQIILSWPATATGYVLESSDKVTSGTWTAVTGVANSSVTITPAAGNQFFRLKKP